ncbi:topoisomerase C-terminal repeat-containing protein [Leuconostoc suionicum]
MLDSNIISRFLIDDKHALKGLQSKKGKSFDAKLKLDGHKMYFAFD